MDSVSTCSVLLRCCARADREKPGNRTARTADGAVVPRVIEFRSRADRFVLKALLGRGGAAEAWHAVRETPLFSQEVCLKRPTRTLTVGERRAVVEEARILSRVRHCNVVSLLDVQSEADGTPWLVLELVRGLDLRHLIGGLRRRGERLAPSTVAYIGGQVCRGLAAANRAVAGGLVHRDISPHNVLVSLEGEVKLADFGVARAFDRERWTRPGRIKGKASYVPPEAIRGKPVDYRGDLFALGVVMYELLAGRRPFEGRTSTSTLRAITRGDRAALITVAPDVPIGLAEVVERLLAHHVNDRPASADLTARLLACHSDGDIASSRLRLIVRRLAEVAASGSPTASTVR